MSKKSNNITIRSSAAEYLTFVASTNAINENIEVRYENENLWLTQKLISKLYGVEVNTINYHIKKIFSDNELEESSTIRKFRIVQIEGSREVTREVEHYNLSMIIAIGFKVDNEKAVQFRKWANNIVNEYTIKGFSMDDERLKNDGSILSKKYFEEQLERIREIRLSERKFYQKITDIYATSIDYDVTSTATKRFFATVQNKLHWAIHGQTAAEVVYNRADSQKDNMGLNSWKDAPNGKIQKFDVTVAKNYLNDKELASLQRLVSAYLDLAEDMALREIPMTMLDWESRLNKFIEATDRKVLNDSGKISAEIAKTHALSEFEKYRVIQDKNYLSDFDKQITILEIENKKSSENE